MHTDVPTWWLVSIKELTHRIRVGDPALLLMEMCPAERLRHGHGVGGSPLPESSWRYITSSCQLM